jgi:flagellar FliL protein
MNRYMPLVILVVFGQAVLAYLLVDQIVVRRLMGGALPEEVKEVKADIPISDEPERIYRALGEFLINPADTSDLDGLRFLRANITLGVSPAKVHSEFEKRHPMLRDIVISILSAKTVAEMDDPEDREFIKDEVKFALEEVLKKDEIHGEVLRVYFTNFIIQ